jgi:hypothetical protein
MTISERDWKLLRSMKQEKLNKACGEILSKVEAEIKRKEHRSQVLQSNI